MLIRDRMKLETLMAYGTSEGVTKAWDTRGRGTRAVAKQYGYRQRGIGPGGATHWQHSSTGHVLRIQRNGDWRHMSREGQGLKYSNGPGALEDHLASLHGPRKY